MRASELRLKIASQDKEAFPNPFAFLKRDATSVLNPAAGTTIGDVALQAATISGAAGLVGALGMAGFDAAENAINKGFAAAGARMGRNRGYKKMLEATGEEDSDTRRNAFNTLHTFAPDLAKDPMVAGTFVKRVVDFDENIDPTWVKTLVETQQRHRPTIQRGPSGAGAVFGGSLARGLQSGFSDAAQAARYQQDYALKSRAADIADAREGRDITEAERRGITFDSGSPFQRIQEQNKKDVADSARATQMDIQQAKDKAEQARIDLTRAALRLNLLKAQDEGSRTRVEEYYIDPTTGTRSLIDDYETNTPKYPQTHGQSVRTLQKKASLDRARSLRARSTRASDLRMRFGG